MESDLDVGNVIGEVLSNFTAVENTKAMPEDLVETITAIAIESKPSAQAEESASNFGNKDTSS